MKMKQTICDRCKKLITFADDQILDFLDREYAGRDICPECDTQIQVAGAVLQESMISGKPQKQVAEEWLKLYEE